MTYAAFQSMYQRDTSCMADPVVAQNLADVPELVTSGDLGDELASFIRAQRANDVSPNAILAYGGAVRQFGRWLMAHDYPTVSAIEPRHIVAKVPSTGTARSTTRSSRRCAS